MGQALEIISGRVDSVAATLTAVTNNTGDSNTVRNFVGGSMTYLCGAWALSETASILQVKSARMHDNLQDMRFAVPVTNSRPLFPAGVLQPLYAQDSLTIQATSGAADQTIESLLMYYSDAAGLDSQLRTWDQVRQQIKNIVTIETSNVSGATVGDYGGQVALNAGVTDVLKANVPYALLGYNVNVEIGSVGVRGADTGNVRVGGPGTIDHDVTHSWFVDMSKATGLPMIPVINGANKANTFVDITHATAAITVLVDTIWAELAA